MNFNVPKTDFGVVIGRFQVPELHDAHKDLISGVINRHSQVLILLGVPRALGTIGNPLDYKTRKLMIEKEYPNVFIAPIVDTHCDETWSKNVDEIVHNHFPIGTVMLYGGRDSFTNAYSGRYKTAEVSTLVCSSGTDIRNNIRTTVPSTPEGRAGVIYATENKYGSGLATVDIIPLKCEYTKDILKRFILLGKKNHENGWRMIGGFFDPDKDDSLEDAAKREFCEETNYDLNITDWYYLFSKKVNDPRYIKSKDKIITSVFLANIGYGSVKASDDINELKYFDINDIINNRIVIVKEHKDLLNIATKYILERQ